MGLKRHQVVFLEAPDEAPVVCRTSDRADLYSQRAAAFETFVRNDVDSATMGANSHLLALEDT